MNRRIYIALITLSLLIGLALRGEGRKAEAAGEPLEATRESKTLTGTATVDRGASGLRLASAAALPGVNQGQNPNLPDLN